MPAILTVFESKPARLRMPVETTDQFVDKLKQSEIASEEVIALWLERAGDHDQPVKLAKSLIKLDFLTAWQGKFLLSGRHRLKYDNYLLVNRIKSNSIGDQFVAKHLKLGQRVRILFLAKELSKKLEQRQSVLRLAASASEFNHSNLEHLHTIDRIGGRYLIVTDFDDASSLDDPETLAVLEPGEIPKIMSQFSAAMVASHSNGLSHGALAEPDLQYDSAGDLKVQNLISSFLVHNLADDYVSPVCHAEADTTAIVKTGQRLLKRFSDRCSHHEELQRILGDLASGSIGLADASAAFAALRTDAAAVHVANSRGSANEESGQPSSDQTQFPDQPQALERTEPHTAEQPARFWSNRWLLVAASAGLLVAVSFGLYAAGMFNSSPRYAGQANYERVGDEELPTLATKPETDAVNGNSSLDGNSPFPEKTKVDSPANSESLPGLSDLDPSDLAVNLETDSGAAGTGEELPQSPDDTDTGLPDVGTTSETGEPMADEAIPQDESTNSILNSFKSLTGSTETSTDTPPKQSTKKTDAEQPEKLATDTTDVTEFTETKASSGSATSEKVKFPSSVKLPDTSSADAVGLVQFNTSTLDLELIADGNVSKSNVQFEMVGDQDSGWQITSVSTKSAESRNVARLQWNNQELQFGWDTAAADSPTAGFLANCILKSKSDSGIHFISLRKPVPISDFVLDRAEGRVRVEIEGLNFLPKTAYAELHELDEEEFGATFTLEDQADRKFGRRTPFELQFRDLPEYQMLHLALTADLKNRSRVEAKLRVRLVPGQKAELADSKTVDEAKVALEQQIEDLKSQVVYLGRPIAEIRAEQNLSKQQFSDKIRNQRKKEIEEFLKLAEGRSEEFRKILTQIEPFYAQPIPVSVYFEIGGRRVVLATSVLK